MKKKRLQRNYSMSDIKLLAVAVNLRLALERSLEELSIFGLTAEKIQDFKSLINDFNYFDADLIITSDIMIATNVKKARFFELKEQIRKMALRFQLKWGAKSSQANNLGITGMNNLIDDSLIMLAKRVLEQLNLHFEELATDGLTQEMIDNYENLINLAETALNNQKNQINLRNEKTIERIQKGNELYNLVTKYSEMGKKFYANISSSKYKAFVIYK